MSIRLTISVPNVNSLLATYDSIRVYRSVVSSAGPFVELTSAVPSAASLTGAVVGPFIDLNGKTLILRTATESGVAPDVTVSFTDPNPISIAQVVAAIGLSTFAGVASSSGGALKLTTTALGQFSKLTIVGGSALADLGFSLYQSSTGTDNFISLVANQTTYGWDDPDGTNSAWYQWRFFHSISLALSAASPPIHPNFAVVDPNRTIEDFRATKGLTLVRTREFTFRRSFWLDQAAGIPMLPDGSGAYPQLSIFDINGQLVATGMAAIDGTAPNYKFPFLVPADAILSTDDRRWRAEWLMVTDTGRQVQSVDEFDVRDVDVTETEVRELSYLAMENMPFRVRLRLPTQVASITFLLRQSPNTQNILIPETSVVPFIIDGDTVVYYFDIGPNILVSSPSGQSSYQVIWSIQETATSSTDFVWQVIEVPPGKLLTDFVDLRRQIDRIQKKQGQVQAYADSDIMGYLREGIGILNSIHPANLVFDLTTVPPLLHPWWILASMLVALTSQQIVEIDLAFQFSGQAVTLDYDRASALEAAIGRAISLLQSQVQAAKMQLFRSTSPVGAYAGRAQRLTGNNNFVYLISQGGSQNFLTLLQQVGLL